MFLYTLQMEVLKISWCLLLFQFGNLLYIYYTLYILLMLFIIHFVNADVGLAFFFLNLYVNMTLDSCV